MTEQNYKSGWSNIDQTENPAYYIQFMNRVRPQDDAPEPYQSLFTALGVKPGQEILDVGCGTGGTMRALAQHEPAIGRIVGVDNSAVMIAEAEKRAAGSNWPLTHHVIDAHQLPFADNSFDGCFATGVFEIIEQPQTVLAEMARVLRPGGRLVVITGDIDATMIDATNRTVTRKIIHYANDYEGNGWIGRQLPGFCHDLGLANIQAVPRMMPITRYEMWAELWWQGWAEAAAAAGTITAEELQDWLADLQARDRAGKFFAAWAGITVSARKPD